MATLYMMFGYPGAGKTTTADAISKSTGAAHLSSDKMRLELFPAPTFSQQEHDAVYVALNSRTEQLLRAGKDVVYDANLNRLAYRKEKYDICRRIGAKPLLFWVQTAKELSKFRAVHESRQRLWPEGEDAESMFDRIADILEEPGPAEPYIAIDGTKVMPHYIKAILGL